jgi:hypothetical protein
MRPLRDLQHGLRITAASEALDQVIRHRQPRRERGAGPGRALDVSSRRRADRVQQLCQSMEVM